MMVCTLTPPSIPLHHPKNHLHRISDDNPQHHEIESFHVLGDLRAVITQDVPSVALRLSSSRRTAGIRSKIRWENSSCYKVSWFRLARKLQTWVSLCFGILLVSTCIFVICTVNDSMNDGSPGISRAGEQFKSQITRELLHSLRESVADHVRVNEKDKHEAAMRGLGVVFSKGTRTMDELIVANFPDHCNLPDFRLFLRTLHRSGAMAKGDLVLLFPWRTIPKDVFDVVSEEAQSFQKLIASESSSEKNSNISVFNALAFRQATVKNANRKISSSSSVWGDITTLSANQVESSLGWGSVVGFQMSELDPDNVFSKFLNNSPSQLRRWLCYEMLLGKLRRRFKRVMLVELGGVVILGDALASVRKQGIGLYLTLEDGTWADVIVDFHDKKVVKLKSTTGLDKAIVDHFHDKQLVGESKLSSTLHKAMDLESKRIGSKGSISGQDHQKHNISSDKIKEAKKRNPLSLMDMVYGDELGEGNLERRMVSSKVIMGSVTAVKGLANSMVIEVVRMAILQRKSKLQAFPDKALVSYLVQKSSILGRKVTGKLKMVGNDESVVHVISSILRQQTDVFRRSGNGGQYAIVLMQGGDYADIHGGDKQRISIGDLIQMDICCCVWEASFYDDCHKNGTSISST